MTWRILPIGFLWFWSVVVFANPQLQLHVDKTNVDLGDAVIVQLTATDMVTSLSQIDLSPLEENFGVVVKETRSEQLNNHTSAKSQTVDLELYPRSIGTLTIPPVTLDNKITAAFSVIVHNPKIIGHDMAIHWTVSKNIVWERQQVVVKAVLQTPERFAMVEVPQRTQHGIDTYLLPVEKRSLPVLHQLSSKQISMKQLSTKQASTKQTSTKQLKTEFSLTWLIYPQTAGTQQVVLPEIYYLSQGLVKRKFFLPKIELKVKPLPPYVPPTMPVGRVSITAKPISGWFLKTNAESYWVLTLQSHALIPQWFPPVLRQVTANNGAVRISAVDSRRTTEPTADGALAKVIHNIPFSATDTGQVTLPPLRVQYFDPDSAKLKTVMTRPISVYALNPLLLNFVYLLGTIGVLAVVWLGGRWLKLYLHRRRRLKKAIDNIRQSTNPHALREALKQYAQAVGWPANISLSEFYRFYHLFKQKDNEPLRQFLRLLSEGCYSKKQFISFSEIKSGIIEFLL